MILSKPVINFLGFYFDQLFNHPIRTKAVSCCAIATAGNAVSQYISGVKTLNHNSLLAYGLFGLLFGGTVPHYFYAFLDEIVSEATAFPIAKKLLIERLLYSPLYHAFALYTIARFEGKNHKKAMEQLQDVYWIVLTTSWKYLTLIQIVNLAIVPAEFRVLILSLVAFFWIIYIANERRRGEKKSKSK